MVDGFCLRTDNILLPLRDLLERIGQNLSDLRFVHLLGLLLLLCPLLIHRCLTASCLVLADQQVAEIASFETSQHHLTPINMDRIFGCEGLSELINLYDTQLFGHKGSSTTSNHVEVSFLCLFGVELFIKPHNRQNYALSEPIKRADHILEGK